MTRILTSLLPLLLVLSSCKFFDKGVKTEHVSADTLIEPTWPVSINYPARYDSSKFSFDTISKESFEKFKIKYNSKINPDSTKIARTDTSLNIKTSDSLYVFRVDVKNYSHYAEYIGFLTPLNLYIISTIEGEDVATGSLILIDHKTNKRYEISSLFDDPCAPPLISPGNNYLLSYANTVFEDNSCFITLMKINKNKGRFSYEGLVNFPVDDWKIHDLVWIDEHSFALYVVNVTNNSDGGIMTEQYLRVTF